LFVCTQACKCHVHEVSDAEGYYRLVCKVMVEEAIEIGVLQVSARLRYIYSLA